LALDFAAALERNGIKFIGPTVQNLKQFGDKTAAKEIAIKNDIPVIAGSDDAFPSWVEAREWINSNTTYPVIVKAAMGGGGRGIRVVMKEDELKSQFVIASK
jgi:pyruvate carboxylase